MKQHRVWIAGAFAWLFVLFNIERIYEPIDLASFVYVMATAGGVAMLLWRRLRHWSLAITTTAAFVVFVVLRIALGYSITLESLPYALAEATAIAITMLLAAKIGRNTDTFSESTSHILGMLRGRHVPDLEALELDMQREIQRARRYERPLTAVTIHPRVLRFEESLADFVAQLENELVQLYAHGELADLLRAEVRSDDLLAWDGQRFVMLLPEADREAAERMLDRVGKRIAGKLGIEMEVNMADFPNDEITFSGLLDRLSRAPATPAEPRKAWESPSSRDGAATVAAASF